MEAVQKHNAQYLILDDGFQHLNMKRDLDIVMVNATNPFGNGHLIPAGNLREPVAHLKRASLFVITHSFFGRNNMALLRQKLKTFNDKAMVYEADHRPVRFVDYRKDHGLPLDMVKGQKVAVVSAIEDAHSFEGTISRLGADVAYAARFQDHHQFTEKETEELFTACRDFKVRYLITTIKDAYRLKKILKPHRRYPVRIIMLEIELRINDEEGFIRQCLQRTTSLSV
jgi:tetraacyldisaccharide 4'-kinase